MASINNQKGVSLYLAIIIMIIVLGIALGMATISYKQIKGAQETGNSVLAFFAADTGMEQILKSIKDTSAMSVGGGVGLNPSYSDTLINEATYSAQIECCSSNDSNCNFYSEASVVEDCPDGLLENEECLSPRFCVKSQGNFRGVTRAVAVGYGIVLTAPILNISASPTPITLGQSSTITWSSFNVDTCVASGDWPSVDKPLNGSEVVTPSTEGTKYYRIDCHSDTYGDVAATAIVDVTILPVPTIIISATPSSITLGQSSTLAWSSSNVTSCTASGDWSGSKAINGSENITPGSTGSKSYTIDCTGVYGSASSTATVNVTTLPSPTIIISATPSSITLGQSSTLAWSSSNVTSCTASGDWSGSKAINGSENITPGSTGSKSYTIDCTGVYGSASSTATVNVNSVPNTPPIIISVVDSPDPVSVGSSINFSVNWSDANAEGIRMYICKANDGGTSGCGVGGTWCSYTGAFTTTNPITCNYNALVGDMGFRNYYAYVCDDEPSCSPATLGLFTVRVEYNYGGDGAGSAYRNLDETSSIAEVFNVSTRFSVETVGLRVFNPSGAIVTIRSGLPSGSIVCTASSNIVPGLYTDFNFSSCILNPGQYSIVFNNPTDPSNAIFWDMTSSYSNGYAMVEEGFGWNAFMTSDFWFYIRGLPI